MAWGLGYVGSAAYLGAIYGGREYRKISISQTYSDGSGWCWCPAWVRGDRYGRDSVFWSSKPLSNPETVFITLSQQIFNPWVAGIITAAILSAIMSTIDSQLLVSSSVISEDFYRVFVRPRSNRKRIING